MATRFTGTSASPMGVMHTLKIEDADGGAGSVDISIGGDGFRLTYDTEEEDPISPILSSTVEFSIIATPSTASDISDFITDLLTAEETRFRLRIEDESGNLWWVGYIVPDKVYQEDTAWADTLWELRIQAIDGIGRLKDLEYNADGVAYSGRVLIKEHIFNILEKIGLSTEWGATDDFLYVINRFYEDGMSATLNVSPFDRTYIDHSVFYSVGRDGSYKYRDCYEVLKQLMQLMLCRFYLSAGVYRISQISDYKETGSIYRHRYYSDGTKPGTTSSVDLVVEENVDGAIRLEGTRYYWFAPLRKAVLTYKHLNDRNYIIGYIATNTSAPDFTTSNFDRGVRLRISGLMQHKLDFTALSSFATISPPAQLWFKFNIRVVIGGTTYYLKRDPVYQSGLPPYTFTDPEWTTDSSDRCSWVGETQYDSAYVTDQVDFMTPELPGSGSFAFAKFDVEFYNAYKAWQVQDPLLYTETWRFYDASLQTIADDEETLAREVEYVRENTDLENASEVAEYETLFADSDSFFTSASLTVYDGSADPVASNSWTRGLSGTGQKLQELFLEEVMKIRKYPLRRLEGELLSSAFMAHNVLQLTNAAQYVLLRGSYQSARDTWSGQWMFIDYADSVTAAPVTKTQSYFPPGPGEPPIPPAPPPTYEPWSANDGILGGSVVGILFDNGGHVGTLSSAAIERDAAVTSIDISPVGIDGLINAGDDIILVNPITGATQTFTVAADVAASDTAISVNADTADDNFYEGSIVTVSTDTFVGNIYDITRPVRYAQTIAASGASVTVTANGGELPASGEYLDVYYNGMLLEETQDYTVSGDTITFAGWTPETGSRITVKFWI